MSDNMPSSRPRGQNDPGWNDPPPLQFNTVQTGNKTRLNLNKRVAFPLQGSTATTSKPTAIVHPSHPPLSTPPVAIVPPMSRTIPPSGDLAVNTSTPTESRLGTAADIDTSNLSDSERQACLDTFNSFVPRIQAGINIRPDEVQRRINLMNQMWLSGTLAPSVQRKIQSIAKALADDNFEGAMEFHRTLVVEHSNICMAWGAALRQIILTIQLESGDDAVAVVQGQQTVAEPENDSTAGSTPANAVQHI